MALSSGVCVSTGVCSAIINILAKAAWVSAEVDDGGGVLNGAAPSA